MITKCSIFFASLLLAIASSQAALASDRLKLWEIVTQECIPNQEATQNPFPCVEINKPNEPQNGYVIFPDRNGIAQFLLIPTRRITGIESPALEEVDLPNYWRAAWNARIYTFNKLHNILPWNAMGLAINSQPSRSQDQMHIHIDCLQPQVSQQLQQHIAEIRTDWSTTAFELMGKHYRVKRIANLDSINPFRSLIDELGVNPTKMGQETLVIAGVVFKHHNNFVLLEDHVDQEAGDPGHGEDLLDASCAIAEHSSNQNPAL